MIVNDKPPGALCAQPSDKGMGVSTVVVQL